MDGFLAVGCIQVRCVGVELETCIPRRANAECRIECHGGAVIVPERPWKLPLTSIIEVERAGPSHGTEVATEKHCSSLEFGKVTDLVAQTAVRHCGGKVHGRLYNKDSGE